MDLPNVSGCNPRLSAERIEVLTSFENRLASQFFKSDEITRYADRHLPIAPIGRGADRLMVSASATNTCISLVL
jgi:hypothetical protein